VPNESNSLEQISAARRRAETWLKEAEDYLSKGREPLEGGVLSGKQARKEIEALTYLENEGSSCLQDLDRLLRAASHLFPSQLRSFEPKFSRARPIMLHASAVLEQISGVHEEIVSLKMILSDYISAYRRRSSIGGTLRGKIGRR
jgi:hypothetical protein